MGRVLITGISGGLGRHLARRLAPNMDVCGADLMPWNDRPVGVRVHRVDLRKRRFEDVVRTERPDAVVHMGFIRHFRKTEELRHDVNVRGTQRVLSHCVRYGVKQLIVLSSSYVYGAFAENPYRVDEDFPLSASRSYPEIRDLVEVDTLATAFLWRHPEVQTCVLRPVSVLGPHVHSMIRAYLSLPRVPTVLGFNPMFQLIAEDDLCEAVALCLEQRPTGVFNVTGSGELPLHTIIEEVGAKSWPIPGPLLHAFFERAFRLGVWSYPAGMLDFLKYPLCLDGRRFEQTTGYGAKISLRELFSEKTRRRMR